MTPLDRLRLEKAATDCGFEMTPVERDDGLDLRSARFPESVFVQQAGQNFVVTVSNPLLLDANDGPGPVAIAGLASLYQVLRTAAAHARTLPNRVAEQFRRETAGLTRTTEAERLVVQRVGQNVFRAALLLYWQGRCCVTGLEVPELLRASHIKPWAACDSDDERLDVFNGLLMAPQVDALFDGGWISFADSGGVVVSPALPLEASAKLGLSSAWRASHLSDVHRAYMAYHRLHVLRG